MLLEEGFLKEALTQAQLSEKNGEVPVGAVIVLNNKIIARSINSREQKHDPLGHAECNAIERAAEYLKSWRLVNCDLFVTLEPCVMCLAACQQARVRKVYFGAKDPKGGAISLGYKLHQDKKLNHQFDVEYMPMQECERILSEFFKQKRIENKGD